MNQFIKIAVLSSLYLHTSLVFSQQTCRTEVEVNSTTPSSRYIDNNDGSITDTQTSLMWQKCEMGVSGLNCDQGVATVTNWQFGLELANSNDFLGFTDWRLPNIRELKSLVERRCYNPAINLSLFPNTSSSFALSSSPGTGAIEYFNKVDFTDGNSLGLEVNNVPGSVRLVRNVD
jgi:hypothetical protein